MSKGLLVLIVVLFKNSVCESLLFLGNTFQEFVSRTSYHLSLQSISPTGPILKLMSLVPGDTQAMVSGTVSMLKILRDENKKNHVLLCTVSKLYINFHFYLKDLWYISLINMFFSVQYISCF